MHARRHLVPLACVAGLAVVWVWAAIAPLSRSDWALEQILVVLAVGAAAATYRWRPVSDLSYALLALFLAVHLVGSHWSYSNVPGFDWGTGTHQNVYDRLVHFLFGALLWLPATELLRWVMPPPLARGAAGVVAVFAASALYEVIEWVVVLIVAPELGAEFLGAQGDPFDAVKDMALGLAGGVAAAALALAARPALRRSRARRPAAVPRAR
ncbi:MAG TPA: DUF2238 domain-containing protein [Candidatus Thermoplasmatota archaeon]|nr:DUF2238 domain-containing protein [Candidatus Thermoplasmatota archaeon]